MIIYLAGGFTVMNVPGREKYLLEKYGGSNRLMSFWFYGQGVNIMQIIDVKKELKNKEGDRK